MNGRRRRPRPQLPMLQLNKQLADISQSESSKSKYGVQVSENLFISNIYQASDPEFIKGHNITAIISVHSKELPNQLRESVESYKHFKLKDIPDVRIAENFDEAIQFIDKNKRTLVHCQWGVSESATLCLAYLIKKEQITLDEAVKKLRSKRGCIEPNFLYLCQLKSWEAKVLLDPNPNKVSQIELDLG